MYVYLTKGQVIRHFTTQLEDTNIKNRVDEAFLNSFTEQKYAEYLTKLEKVGKKDTAKTYEEMKKNYTSSDITGEPFKVGDTILYFLESNQNLTKIAIENTTNGTVQEATMTLRKMAMREMNIFESQYVMTYINIDKINNKYPIVYKAELAEKIN